MTEVYKKIANNISHTVFKSSKILFTDTAKVITGNQGNTHSLYPFAANQTTSEKEAIKTDFGKIGNDLFGALNKYEGKHGYKLTPRYR